MSNAIGSPHTLKCKNTIYLVKNWGVNHISSNTRPHRNRYVPQIRVQPTSAPPSFADSVGIQRDAGSFLIVTVASVHVGEPQTHVMSCHLVISISMCMERNLCIFTCSLKQHVHQFKK